MAYSSPVSDGRNIEHSIKAFVYGCFGSVRPPRRPLLDDPTRIHHRNPVRQIGDHDGDAPALTAYGEPPSPVSPPPRFRYNTRCPLAINQCRSETPSCG